uniref:Uncharacterized protein n=1 Tax=Rhizophora mucronata TaxID=61149 RepID=A0A2P2MEL9_RHIMU
MTVYPRNLERLPPFKSHLLTETKKGNFVLKR